MNHLRAVGLMLLGAGCGGRLATEAVVSDDAVAFPEVPVAVTGPAPAACADVQGGWPWERTSIEHALIRALNARREKGAHCEGGGWMSPAAPVVLDPKLTCAARGHSVDMSRRKYLAHLSPEGLRVRERILAVDAGYGAVGENLAAGYFTAEAVLHAWLESAEHCLNLMSPVHAAVGVGYVPDWGVWTLILAGRPPSGVI